MKINKKYLFQYLKLFTSRYRLKDCHFYSFNNLSHLSTSRGFYPEFYISCTFVPDFDICEVHVYQNFYDFSYDDSFQLCLAKFGPKSLDCYKGDEWRDLL